jgi:hypothetical protein
MEMLVVFFVQIFKKDGTFYPLEVCMWPMYFFNIIFYIVFVHDL